MPCFFSCPLLLRRAPFARPSSQAGFFLIVLLAGGCAATSIGYPPASQPGPAAPNVNLAGYPQAFKEGYGDGCASARMLLGKRKDERRFKSDSQYAQGWRDGYDICRRR